MHDPMTVAFEIRYPWPWPRMRWGKWHGPRSSIITIWHVDPEIGGSDDSCGWFRPPLSKDQKSALEHFAKSEAEQPWFKRERAKIPLNPSDAEALLRGALLVTARMIRARLSLNEATEMASTLLHNPSDNLRGDLCLLPGWHTNFDKEDMGSRVYESERFFFNLGGLILRRHRPWYRHPRWHIRHWSFQVHAVQKLKRWLFSRCAGCGKRFTWGYAPTSHQWKSGGPRWFRSEHETYHHDCSRPENTNESKTPSVK